MLKILIAECKQEVSTFNPNHSGYEDFGIRYGNELLDYHRTIRNEIGGALSILDATPLTIGDAKILKDFTLFGSVNSTL